MTSKPKVASTERDLHKIHTELCRRRMKGGKEEFEAFVSTVELGRNEAERENLIKVETWDYEIEFSRFGLFHWMLNESFN